MKGDKYKNFISRVLSYGRGFKNHAFIVGAQKSGTGSFHHWLSQHPGIAGAMEKEVQFFQKNFNYQKGTHWYLSRFPLWNRNRIALDSTPEYMYVPAAAERIRLFCPSAKIIILLRDPISRALSAFNMYSQMFGQISWIERLETNSAEVKAFYEPIALGITRPDIQNFLDKEIYIIKNGKTDREPALIRRGLYAAQVKRYFDLFGPDQVHVIFTKELNANPKAQVNRAFDFLGLPRLEDLNLVQQHVREYSVSPEIRCQIEMAAGELFEHDKEQLAKVLGGVIPW